MVLAGIACGLVNDPLCQLGYIHPFAWALTHNPNVGGCTRTCKGGTLSRMNQLYYGNNLPVLRDHIRDESVNLVYLDPPFNSNQDYNVLFAERDGSRAAVADQGV